MKTKDLLKKVRKIEIKTRRLSNNIFGGEYHSAFKGRGMTFSEVRSYQYGDDVRTIDWNVTARYNEPFVKVFEEERELTLMLLVDISGSEMFGGKKELKKNIITEISATLAFSALQNNDKVGLILFSDQIELYIPPSIRKIHVLRIIRELIEFKPKSKKTDISEAFKGRDVDSRNEILDKIFNIDKVIHQVENYLQTLVGEVLSLALPAELLLKTEKKLTKDLNSIQELDQSKLLNSLKKKFNKEFIKNLGEDVIKQDQAFTELKKSLEGGENTMWVKKMCQRVGGERERSTSDQEIKEAAVKFFFNFPGNIYVIREQCGSLFKQRVRRKRYWVDDT